MQDLLRKVIVQVDEITQENGVRPAQPARRAVAAAVLKNPWVGTSADTDLQPEVVRVAPELAQLLTDRLQEVLGGTSGVEAFGKGALIGSAGELEHGAALIHTPYFGNLVREYLEGESIICFADDRVEAGEALTIPMWHKVAAATRSHYQTTRIRIPDAPRRDEIVVLAAASTGPRPHPRIGDRTTDPVVTSKEITR